MTAVDADCPATHGGQATDLEPQRIPFDAEVALHSLAKPLKVMASALAGGRVGLNDAVSSLSQLRQNTLNNKLWSAGSTHKILDVIMSTLDALEGLGRASECVSFWKSTGVKCETADAIGHAIKCKVAAFKNTRHWLECLQSRRSGLSSLIETIPAGLTVQELDKRLEPMFKVQTCRGDLDAPLGQGFQLKGLLLRSPNSPHQTPRDGKVDFDSSYAPEPSADDLIR